MMTIRDYVRGKNDNLATKLDLCLCSDIFLPSSRVELRALKDGLWFDVFLGFTLSCNDLAELNTIFEGCWWCISPSADEYAYKFSVDLKFLNIKEG